MINVGMYYKVKSGHESEFESAFSGVIEKLKSSDTGIKDAKLYREIGKSEYMIYTEWESMDAFKNFIQSKSFSETTTSGRSIIDGKPSHRVFKDFKE